LIRKCIHTVVVTFINATNLGVATAVVTHEEATQRPRQGEQVCVPLVQVTDSSLPARLVS
jgi:hypothetical protein